MTNRRGQIIASIFLVLVTLSAYGEVSKHQFIHFDDGPYVTENQAVRQGLTLKGLTWAFSTPATGNWIPLTWLSHMLDCQVFGLRAGGHHLTSLLFHVLNTLLLFLWLHRTTRALGPAFLVAALFAWHPLHVESVAWVSERKDVLSAFFWLLTMWAYVRYVERPGWGRYLLILLSFSLGLLAKPMLVTLPLVLLLLDYWPLERWAPGRQVELREGAGGWRPRLSSLWGPLPPPHERVSPGVSGRRLIWEKIPLLFLSALCSAVTVYTQMQVEAVAPLEALPLSSRLAHALVAYVWYLVKMVWPAGLAVLYPYPLDSPSPWLVLGAGFLLALISLLVVRQARRHPYLLVGWLWYLGTLLPVIGLVQVGRQAWADHFTYVPLIGLFIMVAWGARDVCAPWRGARFLLPGAAAIILGALLTCTWMQVRLWRDSLSLFTHTLRVTGDNPLIHNNLGVALASQGKMEEAFAHFVEAMRLNPNNARAQNKLGEELAAQGRMAEAVARFQRAVKVKPDFAEAYNNLGKVYAHQGNIDQARAMFHKAIDLDPNFAEAYKNLGLALAKQGKKLEAVEMLEKAVQINPNFADAQKMLNMLKAQGLN